MDNFNFVAQAFLDGQQTVLKYDLTNDTLTFFKYVDPVGDWIRTDVTYDAREFLENFLGTGHIHPEDEELFDPDELQNLILDRTNQNDSGHLFTYRHIADGKIQWRRLVLAVPAANEPGTSGDAHTPTAVLIYRRNLPHAEANREEARNVIAHRVIRAFKYNITTGDKVIIKQSAAERHLFQEKQAHTDTDLRWFIEETMIHPSDLPIFHHFTDPEVIEEYFASGSDSESCYYRRKVGGFYRWVRLTLQRSTEYSEQYKWYIYILEDVQDGMAHLFDQQGLTLYANIADPSDLGTEIYHSNLLSVLTYLTQKYIDFYMIDLKRDKYIMYKIRPETVNGNIPCVGTYSEVSRMYAKTYFSKEQDERLKPFASIENLRKMLAHKTAIEYSYIHQTGQKVKTICTKIEAEKGIPSKVICCTVPNVTKNLLKVRTFGNFEVWDEDGTPIKFTKKQSKQLLAYLIDKQGYPAATKDIVEDVLEKEPGDLNAVKYVSTLARLLVKDLETAGYDNIVVREWNTLRIATDKIDCDYYHLLAGDPAYWRAYHNEYMKEYSWAEETNSEILFMTEK